MRRVTRWVGLVAALALVGSLAGSLAGCGGGSGDPTKANLRFVNASSGYGALDLLINDTRRFSSLGFGETATYAEVDPSKMSSVVTLPGSTTALVSLTPAVAKKASYTLLAWGPEGALNTVLLDDNAAAESGKTRLRVLNAAPDAGRLDLYLTGAAEPLASAVALFAGVNVGALSSYSTLASTGWRLRVTAAGNKAELLLDLSGLALAAGQVGTLVITPSTGGVLVNGLLLSQQGGIVPVAGAHARVRVAAPNAGSVTASAGGTLLLNAATTPAVGPYVLVPAGRQGVLVSVDGVALTVPDVTLAPGTDQTLLVWRQAGVPATTWLIDDNRLPANGGTAKLRLVHGVDGLVGALAMKASFLPVAADVTAGSASAYAAVTPGLNVRITVSATGAPAPVFDAFDQTLLGGGVYSVFVVEGSAPDSGFLRRDR